MEEKVLVVDDEVTIRDIMECFLKNRGYDVITAASGDEALEKVKTERPDAILMDIRMPGMDGITAIKKIREFDQKVGIIMATAVSDESVARECIEAGASDYIIKPFDLDYLEKTLIVKLAMLG